MQARTMLIAITLQKDAIYKIHILWHNNSIAQNKNQQQEMIKLTEAEKFVPIRKLAESGFLTESRLRKMHKQGKLPGIWCGKKFLVNVPLLNEELDRESKKQLSGGGRNE